MSKQKKFDVVKSLNAQKTNLAQKQQKHDARGAQLAEQLAMLAEQLPAGTIRYSIDDCHVSLSYFFCTIRYSIDISHVSLTCLL